jgi:pyrimidine-nucleoside phosphorylase
VDLGGGRQKKGEAIDYAVGLILRRKVGDQVKRGDPLLVLHANDRVKFDAAKQRLLNAFEFSDTAPQSMPLIHQVIR